MSQTLREMFVISTHHRPDLGEIREAERNDAEPDLEAQGKTEISLDPHKLEIIFCIFPEN